MHSRFLFIAALTPALWTPLRADSTPVVDEAAALLWQQAPLKEQPDDEISQRQFVDHAAREIHLLAEFRAWRELFRAGSASRRDFKISFGGRNLGFTLGAPPPEFGVSTKGLSANWGAFEMGTTLRARSLDEALADFDGVMTGKSASVAASSSLLWSRARGESQRGNWELGWARGENTQQENHEKWSAQGRLKLPAKWQANAAWNRLQQSDTRSTWEAGADGPIAHPWGEARAEFTARGLDAARADVDETGANAIFTQDVQRGILQAQLRASAGQIRREAGEEIQNDATGAAQAQLQVTPNLKLRAQGALAFVDKEREGEDLAQQTLARDGQVALEWNAANAWSLGLTANRSQFDARAGAGLEREDDALALELKRAGDNGWGLALGAREHESNEGEAQRLATLRVEARREIFGVKLRTHLDLARPHDANWRAGETARRVGAQLDFTRAASLDFAVRDGAGFGTAWRGDSLVSSMNLGAGEQELSARFRAGSAAKGNGLGLALEWARNRREPTEQNGKVGITYR